MKVRSVGGNTVVTIPRDLIRLLGIEPGSSLDIHCTGEKIIVDLTSKDRTKLFDPPVKAEAVSVEAAEPVEAA
jgi:antitoxin component of MazEF toxin-antitoxin module